MPRDVGYTSKRTPKDKDVKAAGRTPPNNPKVKIPHAPQRSLPKSHKPMG